MKLNSGDHGLERLNGDVHICFWLTNVIKSAGVLFFPRTKSTWKE